MLNTAAFHQMWAGIRKKTQEQLKARPCYIRIQSAGATNAGTMVVTMVTMEEVKQDAKTATSRETLS